MFSPGRTVMLLLFCPFGENRLIFEIIFWQAVKNKKPYVAMELVQPDTLEEVYANHKKSVEYLLENF